MHRHPVRDGRTLPRDEAQCLGRLSHLVENSTLALPGDRRHSAEPILGEPRHEHATRPATSWFGEDGRLA